MSNPTEADPFTLFSTDAPDPAEFSSIFQSLNSAFDATRVPSTQAIATDSPIITPTATGQTSLDSPNTSTFDIQTTTFSTNTGDTTTTAIVTGTNAADSRSSTSTDNCNSVSCSPGLQAAIAVPIVVIVLGIIGLLIFFARRRRRRSLATDKRGSAGPVSEEKSWSPSYKAAGIHTSDASTMTGGQDPAAPGRTSQTTQRPVSPGIAPPPYGVAAAGKERSFVATNGRDTTSEQLQNLSPVSARLDSPFTDPSLDSREVSHQQSRTGRSSSLPRSLAQDDASSFVGSEAASIHEAQVGRHVSVSSIGRTINHARKSR